MNEVAILTYSTVHVCIEHNYYKTVTHVLYKSDLVIQSGYQPMGVFEE